MSMCVCVCLEMSRPKVCNLWPNRLIKTWRLLRAIPIDETVINT